MQKPTTVKQMVDQIWFALYGTNGSIGMVARLERLEESRRKWPYRAWQVGKTTFNLILLILVFLFGTGIL